MNIDELSLVTNKDFIPCLKYRADVATANVTIDICKFSDYTNIEVDPIVGQDTQTILYENFYKFLIDNTKQTDISWDRKLQSGETKTEHYNSFKYFLAELSMKIYDSTKRFQANKFIISASLLPVLFFIDGFSKADAIEIYGTYHAGHIADEIINADIYVCPYIQKDMVIATVVASDNMTAAVATSIVDNKYSMQLINPDLLIAGKVTE